ncbi:MAG TPA: GDP-mannose 4,6-dehydratase [Candidatus Limnocylindria bacterium]|nr:GDP-mannose 4,6-dehydratase [Candidatus Limnocylindria bacterium]
MGTPRARRALVTGGAGFVGSTLVDRLLADGWEVAALDAFEASTYGRETKLRNLHGALGSQAFVLRETDTRDATAMLAAVRELEPAVIFDLAARAGVRPSIADPAGYVATNIVGFQNTLSAAASVGARVVFASSSSIYGSDDRRPFAEDQARGRPESPYGATKIAGEALAFAHHQATGLPTGVARLFTVYGPRQRPDLAIHAFARRILDREPVVLFDEGRGLRDYTFVTDVVDALLRLANVDDGHLVVNVGSDQPVTTSHVIDELERALGVEADRQPAPAQPGDVPATHADISRAREALGWAPDISFAEGIDRFCAWLLAERAGEGQDPDMERRPTPR